MSTASLDIGTRLKTLRGKLSQEAFSKKIGVPLRTYHRYEAGSRVPPGRVLTKIASACKTTESWILTGAGNFKKARIAESLKRVTIAEELISALGESLEREERLIHKYVKGKAAAQELKKLQAVGEREFVQWLHKWLAEQKEPGGETINAEDAEFFINLRRLSKSHQEELKTILRGYLTAESKLWKASEDTIPYAAEETSSYPSAPRKKRR